MSLSRDEFLSCSLLLRDRMSSSKRQTHRRSSTTQRILKPRKSVWVLLILLLLWSLCLGIGLAQATEPLANHLRNQGVASLGGSSPTGEFAVTPDVLGDDLLADEGVADEGVADEGLGNETSASEISANEISANETSAIDASAIESLYSGAIALSPLPPKNTTSGSASDIEAIGTVDIVPPRYQAGQKIYLDNCATCHLGLPPAIMPTETWRQLIQDPQHYGATIQPLVAPELQVAWQYLRDFSRPHEAGEEIPYRVYQSKFFKALHPRVKLTQRVTLNSCNSCHIGADKYNFRTLSAEWQNAP
jgi:Dihaem cytochrome c